MARGQLDFFMYWNGRLSGLDAYKEGYLYERGVRLKDPNTNSTLHTREIG